MGDGETGTVTNHDAIGSGIVRMEGEVVEIGSDIMRGSRIKKPWGCRWWLARDNMSSRLWLVVSWYVFERWASFWRADLLFTELTLTEVVSWHVFEIWAWLDRMTLLFTKLTLAKVEFWIEILVEFCHLNSLVRVYECSDTI